MDERTMERWRNWWNGEALDRPVIQLYAPRDGAKAPDPPADPAVEWADMDYIRARGVRYLDRTRLLGEATFVLNPNWSVGNACFFGCEPRFRRESVWVDPLPAGPDGLPEIRFDLGSRWLQWMLSFTERAARNWDGRYHLVPYFGNSAADTLSLIMGDEEMMVRIAEDPEWVRSALKDIGAATERVRARAADIISDGMGYASWFGCAADRPVAIADADVSCMISPAQFEYIILPQLAEQIRSSPYSQYHLDGPGALRHLDALLTLKDLNAIQWVPGDGSGGALQWVPLIRRVQHAHKAIQVYLTPFEVLPLLDEVAPEGLCLTVSCASEGQAEALLHAVETKYGAG